MKGLIINNQSVKIGEYSSTNQELLHASLERLFFVEIGTQLGSLDQGSRIIDYFYEPATENTALAIMDEVEFLITTYEVRMVLEAVGVDIVPAAGATGLIIMVRYHLPENPDKVEYLEFVKVRTIQ